MFKKKRFALEKEGVRETSPRKVSGGWKRRRKKSHGKDFPPGRK